MNRNDPGWYREYTGPHYDLRAMESFALLGAYGLREKHKVLDFGCGSLMLGRLLIPFLNRGNYYGIEPDRQLVTDGLYYELGSGITHVKQPHFQYNDDFAMTGFGEKFNYIMAYSIYSHATREQIFTALKSAAEVLENGGVHLATYFPGTEDNTSKEWAYPHYVNYHQETIKEMCNEVGLSYTWLGISTVRQIWFAARKGGLSGN